LPTGTKNKKFERKKERKRTVLVLVDANDEDNWEVVNTPAPTGAT
jgi:hypothetical protein